MKTQDEDCVDCEEMVFDGDLYFSDKPVLAKKTEVFLVVETVVY